jgi:hypothetical protein
VRPGAELYKRLEKFSLTLEATKIRLAEFGRFAHRHAGKRAVDVRKRSIFWALHSIARAI